MRILSFFPPSRYLVSYPKNSTHSIPSSRLTKIVVGLGWAPIHPAIARYQGARFTLPSMLHYLFFPFVIRLRRPRQIVSLPLIYGAKFPKSPNGHS